MSNTNNNTGIWPIVLFIVVGALVAQMFSGGGGSSTTSSPASSNSGSVEYRYAKERFKQEGYNDADSATAAEAVIKFHEAQKARNR